MSLENARSDLAGELKENLDSKDIRLDYEYHLVSAADLKEVVRDKSYSPSGDEKSFLKAIQNPAMSKFT